MHNMVVNEKYINEYKKLITTTNLQKGYQEFIKFFRYLRNSLQKEMIDYKFTGNIVENNMDYSYFQFTDEILKGKGLKIVFVFVHKEFKYQIWLSGVNRQEQIKYFNICEKNMKHGLTTDPAKTDYIVSKDVETEFDYDNLEKVINSLKKEIYKFIYDIV